MVWPEIICVMALLATTFAQNITVEACDCNESSSIGALRFVDTDCEIMKPPRTAQPVKYVLYTNHPETQLIPGIACSRWKQTHQTTTTFFNSVIEIRDHYAIETTAEECVIMKTRKTCGTSPMDYKDGKWSYTKEPISVQSWWNTVLTVEVHCLLEEVALLLEDDENVLTTPIGKINPSAGTYSHNHVTVVWDKLLSKTNPEQRFLLESGNGELIFEGKTFRLVDYSKQTDYHLMPMYNKTDPSELSWENKIKFYLIPSNKSDSKPMEYRIKNSDRLIITINTITKSEDKFTNKDVTAEAHLQFFRDEFTQQENRLASVIRSLSCELRKINTHRQQLRHNTMDG